jgi:AcrR family transcriptional regulator
MPVKAGERLDPDATKARILGVAGQLFYERGVHAVGIQEIADRATASKLTIYRYFHSKEGLVMAVLRARSDRIHEWLEEGTKDVAPGRDRIFALFDLLADWHQQEGFAGCAVMNGAIDTRGDSGLTREVAREHLARYRALLERCLVEAGVPDPTVLARQLLVLIEGATMVSSMQADERVGAETRRVVELLLDSAIPASAAPIPVAAGVQ